jgi:ribosomal protein L10
LSRQVQVQKREPSAEKVATVARIAKLAKEYPVLAVTKLSKVRSAQLMAVRKVLRGQAEIVVVKNKLGILGLKRSGIKNADELLKHLEGQNALIFTRLDPFKLFLLLEKNRVNLAARAVVCCTAASIDIKRSLAVVSRDGSRLLFHTLSSHRTTTTSVRC